MAVTTYNKRKKGYEQCEKIGLLVLVLQNHWESAEEFIARIVAAAGRVRFTPGTFENITFSMHRSCVENLQPSVREATRWQ